MRPSFIYHQIMKIALISDIHGNLVSFETALKAIEADAPDQLICLGDCAADGPKPHECLQKLKSLNIPVIMGNTDSNLLSLEAQKSPDDDVVQQNFNDIEWWNKQQLTQEDLEFINTFYPTFSVDLVSGVELLCSHGSPKSFYDFILAITPDEEVAPMFSETTASLCAGGHTHSQMFRRLEHRILINPGSVGLPFNRMPDGRVFNPLLAEYAILEFDAENNLNVSLKRTPVDKDTLEQSIRDSDMPHKDWWLQDWIKVSV